MRWPRGQILTAEIDCFRLLARIRSILMGTNLQKSLQGVVTIVREINATEFSVLTMA